MRKIAIFLAVFCVSLGAAEFWQAKKFTDWSDRDVKKMLADSPWAKPVNVAADMVLPAGSTSSRRSRDGGRGSITEIGNPNDTPPDPMGDRPQTGVGRSAQNANPDRGTAPIMTYTVRWESALPVKQARVRAQYGSEATSAAEAKQILEMQEPTYVISVSGLRATALPGEADAVKKQMLADTELLVKGKDPIHPVDFMIRRGQNAAVAVFAFPRSPAISLEDKEVEFSAKFGSIPVKQKFQLKNMMFAGKLEL